MAKQLCPVCNKNPADWNACYHGVCKLCGDSITSQINTARYESAQAFSQFVEKLKLRKLKP